MTRPPTSTTRDPRPADRIGLRLEMSPETRDRLMVAAARAGKSMASYLRALVDRHLDEIEAPKTKRK